MQDLTTTITADQQPQPQPRSQKLKVYFYTYQTNKDQKKIIRHIIAIIVYGAILNIQIKREINNLYINHSSLATFLYLWFNRDNRLCIKCNDGSDLTYNADCEVLANNLICKKAEQAVIQFVLY